MEYKSYFKTMSSCSMIAVFLYFQYLEKFSLAPRFTKEEFEHWFIPRDGIIDSFVNVVSV